MNFFSAPSFIERYGEIDYFDLKNTKNNFTFNNNQTGYLLPEFVINQAIWSAFNSLGRSDISEHIDSVKKNQDACLLIYLLQTFDSLVSIETNNIDTVFVRSLIDNIISAGKKFNIPENFIGLCLYQRAVSANSNNPFYAVLGDHYVKADTFIKNSYNINIGSHKQIIPLNNPLYLAAYYMDTDRLDKFLKESTYSQLDFIHKDSIVYSYIDQFSFLKEKSTGISLYDGIQAFDIDYIQNIDICVLCSFSNSFYGQKSNSLSPEKNNDIKAVYESHDFHFTPEKQDAILSNAVAEKIVYSFRDWKWNVGEGKAIKSLITCNKFPLCLKRGDYEPNSRIQLNKLFFFKEDEILNYLSSVCDKEYSNLMASLLLNMTMNDSLSKVIHTYFKYTPPKFKEDDIFFEEEDPQYQYADIFPEDMIILEFFKPLLLIKNKDKVRWENIDDVFKFSAKIFENTINDLYIENSLNKEQQIRAQKCLINFNQAYNQLLSCQIKPGLKLNRI